MLHSSLKEKIMSVPEEYLGEIEDYVDYIIFKYSKSSDFPDLNDVSPFFGCIGRDIDGLAVQRKLRDEWD